MTHLHRDRPIELATTINLVSIPPVLAQSQFATLIGKPPKTVRSWVTTRAVPTVKVGGSRLINIEKLRHDLANGKATFTAGDYP